MKRKKWAWLLILAMLLGVCLSGCANSPQKELEDTARELMEKVKAFDLEGIESFFQDGEAISEEAEDETFGALKSYLEKANGKLTYEIKEVDPDKGTVTICCKYIDSTEFMGNYMVGIFSAAFGGELSDDMTDEELKDAYNKIIEDAAKDLQDTFKEEEITLSFEKTDKGWLMEEPEDAFLNVVMANCINALKSLMENLENEIPGIGETSEYDTNISYTGELTEQGVLLKLKNENSVPVGDLFVQVMFESETGEMLQMGSGYLDLLEAGEEQYAPVFFYGDEQPAAYTVSVSCTPNPGYVDAKVQVEAEHNDGADFVLAKVTNRSGHTLTGISVVVSYYRGDELVGFEQEDSFNITDQKTELMEFSHPMNLNYENVEYDRYELTVTQAYYME